jgi:hypothetical protein
MINEREELQADEDLREIESKQVRLTQQAHLFLENEEWKGNLTNIKDFRVLKMPRIIQSLLYLMKVEREEICEPGTNLLFWKKAKHLVQQRMPELMADYKVTGAKDGQFK